MKHSSTWYSLILILWALLLSAAKTDLPRPRVQSLWCLAEQGNIQSEQPQGEAQPTASAEISETPESAQAIGHSAAQQVRDNRTGGELPICRVIQTWITGITAQGFFNFVIAFATGLLAVFTWKLVRVTRDMHTVSVEATNVSKDSVEAAKENLKASQANVSAANAQAEAAKQSAKAAEMALIADRPYLLVSEFEAVNFVPVSEIGSDPFRVPAIECTLKNFAKGPAVIVKIVARVEWGRGLPAPPDFTVCKEIHAIKDRVIAPDSNSAFTLLFERFLIPDDTFQEFTKGKTAVLIRGVVFYKDVFKKDYETRFGQEYTYGIPNTDFTLKAPNFMAISGYNTFT